MQQPMRWSPVFVFIAIASCQQVACPSPAGGRCDPRNFNCPPGYTCALAEVCTRTCEQTSDCWVKAENGCRSACLPGERLPDGGLCGEESDEGFCPETRLMVCIQGYCQREEWCVDGVCDYDIYGLSEYKGNRSQGPEE